MKTKYIFLLTAGLLFSGLIQAQEVELNTAPPAQPVIVTPPADEETTPALTSIPPAIPHKVQYSFAAGSMFARGLGAATYFRPGVAMHLNNKLSVFGSLSVINNFNTGLSRNFYEGNNLSTNNFSTRNYILNVGGNYMVNDKLNLSGSVWKDLSKQNYVPNMPINVFGTNGTSGMQFRAHYKITENLSVSGGLRFPNGNRYNTLYQQDFMPNGF